MDAVGKFLSDLLLDGSLLVLIGLIADHHYSDMLVSVGLDFLEPSLQVLKRLVAGDIKHKQSHNRTTYHLFLLLVVRSYD